LLIQILPDRLRCIAQHDHGLLSGRLALRWRGLGDAAGPLPFELQLAIALHDVAWEPIDKQPRFNPTTKRPYDFIHHPMDEKAVFYTKGLDQISHIEPHAGLLCSMHYTRFIGTDGMTEFQNNERARRERLKAQLGLTSDDEAMLDAQLHVLKMFDHLSLFVCLMCPSALEKDSLSWLDPVLFAKTPAGESFDLQWRDDRTVIANPFGFDEPLELSIPYRDLDLQPFADGDALKRAWDSAKSDHCSVRLLPPNG